MNHKSYGGEIHLIIDNAYFKMSLVKVLITHGSIYYAASIWEVVDLIYYGVWDI